MGKVVGLLFLLVVMTLVVLSYAKFILGLELKIWRKKLVDQVALDPAVPDFSYQAYSPYDVPVEEHHNSCHWHEHVGRERTG